MSRIVRSASVATLVAFTATGLATASEAATTPSDAGASYIARQLAAGGHQLTSSYNGHSFPATGLSADAILALDSSRTAAGEAAASRAVFDSAVKNYVGYGTDVYAGATAKALITVLAGGQDPKKATGIDLVASLKALENAQGRFADKSSYGDNSSTLTQSLAIIALKKAGQPVDQKAVTNLLSTKCADGGFATNLKNGACVSDTDSTSFAVQALAAAGGQPEAMGRAARHLIALQKADGGLAGGPAAPSENANSTGLAAVAFAVSGHPANAAKARSFVTSLQYGCSFPAAVRGGIAYDAASYATMKKAGVNATVSDIDTRATAQAELALTLTPYVSIVAGGTKDTPSIECATSPKPTPTSKPTPTTKPSSTSAPTTPAPSSTSVSPTSSTSATAAPTTTAPSASASSTSATTPTAGAPGPVVNTDREASSPTLPTSLALAALAATGGAVAFARRR